MLWLLVGGLVAWGIAESEAEKRARKQFERTRAQHSNSINEYRRQIRQYAGEKQDSLEFHRLRQLHWESHRMNQLAWKTYLNGRKSFSGVCRIIREMKKKRREFRSDLSAAKECGDSKRIKEIKGNLRVLNKSIHDFYEEKSRLAEQNDQFHDDMISLQQATAELKYQIRDCCGHGGRIWFEKLEAKKDSNRRAYLG